MAIPVLVVVGLAGAPSDALAQQGLAAARACTSITADAERLACYDRALRTRPAERAQPEPSESTPPRTESPTKRETRAERKARRESAAKKNELEVTIVKVQRIRGRADAFFITDDGQVWKQSDGQRFLTPDPPFRAVISAGSFGSHFLSLPGGHFRIRVFQQRP